jgi:hypothetical protein
MSFGIQLTGRIFWQRREAALRRKYMTLQLQLSTHEAILTSAMD